MQRSESVKELFGALSKFRAQVKQPAKTAKNPYFNSKYVTLEGVMQAVDAALPGTGLAYSQLAENGDNGVSVSTLITHSSGEWMIVGPLTLNPAKRDPQGQGSAITYAKRYQLASAFGISSDIDDDGNVGTFGEDSRPLPRRQPRQAPVNQESQQLLAKVDGTPSPVRLANMAKCVKLKTKSMGEPTLLEVYAKYKQEGNDGPASKLLSYYSAHDERVMKIVSELEKQWAEVEKEINK